MFQGWQHAGHTEYGEIIAKLEHYLALDPKREFYIHGLDQLDEDNNSIGRYPWGNVTEVFQGDYVDGCCAFRATFPKEQVTFIWYVCVISMDSSPDRMRFFPKRIEAIMRSMPKEAQGSFEELLNKFMAIANAKLEGHIKKCHESQMALLSVLERLAGTLEGSAIISYIQRVRN